MTLADALHSVFSWLCSTGATFRPTDARAVSSDRFEIGVEQLQPEYKRRAFVVLPLDCADCWQILEVA